VSETKCCCSPKVKYFGPKHFELDTPLASAECKPSGKELNVNMQTKFKPFELKQKCKVL